MVFVFGGENLCVWLSKPSLCGFLNIPAIRRIKLKLCSICILVTIIKILETKGASSCIVIELPCSLAVLMNPGPV